MNNKHLAIFSICLGFKMLFMFISSIFGHSLILSLIANGFISLFSPMISNKRLFLLSVMIILPALVSLPSDIIFVRQGLEEMFKTAATFEKHFENITTDLCDVFGCNATKIIIESRKNNVTLEDTGLVAQKTLDYTPFVLTSVVLIYPFYDFATTKIMSWVIRKYIIKRFPRFQQFVRENIGGKKNDSVQFL